MKKMIKLLLLVLVTVTPAAAQKLEKANPTGLSKPAAGTYTQVIRAGKLLFIAGQTATNAEGKIVGPGMKEQVDQVFANLVTALKSQGADLSHVAKMTTYVTSISEFRAPDVAAVRAKYVGANPPANTLVQIQQLADPAYKVEIEAVAVLP
jgi:2-iminobutanoate/2-iminopropanoate deaminase